MKTMKRFDCVDMKRRAQETIQAELDGKTPREQFEYWQQRNAEFRKWMSAQASTKRKQRPASRKAQ